MTDAATRTLQALGWRWTDQGAWVFARLGGTTFEVFVPLGNVVLTFDRELSLAGAPLPVAVGACQTAVGFWGSVKRAYKKATRAVKRAIPKSIKRAANKVRKFAGKHIVPALYKLKGIVQSRAAQAIVAGISTAVPVLAPAGAALLAAQEALRHIDTATKVAEQVADGAKVTAKMAKALTKGQRAKATLQSAAHRAKRGSKQAQELFGAVKQLTS